MTYSKSKEKTQLKHLKNSKRFSDTFNKLILENNQIDKKDQEYILLCAVLFFNFYNKDNRYKSYFKLAYYIILKYSLVFKDLRPLYDISLQIGFYPICKTIIDNQELSLCSISEVISHKLLESKFINKEEKYIETLEQNTYIQKLLESSSNSLSYIAPTSFGKSSLISTFITQKNYSKIGIIVPTKSLLVQTFKNIKKLKLNYKLILHDEMYENQERFIGILTQERATRLVNKGGYFDILFIDEAHKIFEYRNDNSRGLILSRLIKMNKLKKKNQKIIYLSPLVENSNNLKSEVDEEIDSYEIKHNLKCEDIFLYRDNKVIKYDKFRGIDLPYLENIDEFSYMKKVSKNKNFFFHYSPFQLEQFAKELFKQKMWEDIHIDESISKILNTLKNEVHPNFYINYLIKKGIVYIHAKMPNIIKEYLEYQFKEIDSLKYLLANSVILEGINLPIDNLFVMSTDYQTGKDLVNLIGRVNRLNYVFKEKNLNKLVSNIHFINTAKYRGRSNMVNHIKYLRDHSFIDEIKNPILEEYDIDNLKFTKTEFESKEEIKEKRRSKDKIILANTSFILNENKSDLFFDKIKKYFIQNNIDDFYNNIDDVIKIIENKINFLVNNYLFMNQDLVLKVNNLFIVDLEKYIIDLELERLKNNKAYKYYRNYLEKMQKMPLKNNINNTYKYFEEKANSNDSFLFIGKTYGEDKKESNKYNHKDYKLSEVYVDLSKYKDNTLANKAKLINLAIVKLKIEEDFVSFKLNKLINFLYDFKLITESEYNIHTYGTEDEELIKLSKIGLNVNIINKLIEDNQYKNLTLNDNGNLSFNNDFEDYLENLPELFKFEIKKYL